MKKFLLSLSLITIMVISAFAEDRTDVISATNMGYSKTVSYGAGTFSASKSKIGTSEGTPNENFITSGAEYSATEMRIDLNSSKLNMQMRSATPGVFYTTTSGGTIKSIKVAKSTVASQNMYYTVYGSNEAYTGNGTNYGTELGSYTSDATIVPEANYEYFCIVASKNGSKAATSYFNSFEIVWSGEVTPVYPTVCEDPIFSFNGKGLLPQETEIEGYAGSTVSIACATKDSNIEWSVTNGDATESLTEYQYVIPEDAEVGTVYEFIAKANVQGENEVIYSEEVTLRVTVLEMPEWDVLTYDVFGMTQTSYGSHSYEDSKYAKYDMIAARNGSKDNYYIQWNNNNTNGGENSGLVASVKEGYYPVKVEVESNYPVDINLFYSNDELTLAGLANIDTPSATLSKTSTSTDIDGVYSYIGIRTASAASTQIYKITITYAKKEAPIAPSAPTLLDSDDFTIENNMLNAEDGVKINFNAVDGIDIYYKLGSNVEQVQTKACTDEHEGYTKHDGNDITLSTIHSALTYFACDPATGLHSEPQTLRLSINTGVAEIEIENGEAEYFNLQGARVANPENGLYIRVVNGKAQKVIVK